MIPRYGFNKCLISEFSFSVFEQYHNRLLGLNSTRGERLKVLFSKKGKGKGIKFVRVMRGVDVTFLLRNIIVTCGVRVEINKYVNFRHKKTALRDAKLFEMLFICVFKFCHECAKPCTES